LSYLIRLAWPFTRKYKINGLLFYFIFIFIFMHMLLCHDVDPAFATTTSA